ncbi:hypothetical protein ACFLSA_02435 [Bacteroidota bacterium]
MINLKKFVYPLSILSILFILFNLIAFQLDKEQIFLKHKTFSIIEILMIFGFTFMILFFIASLIWNYIKMRKVDQFKRTHLLLFLLGIFCLILLFGEKTMVDEIGREMKLGWETRGEMIILYFLLSIQLIYSLFVLILINKSERNVQ